MRVMRRIAAGEYVCNQVDYLVNVNFIGICKSHHSLMPLFVDFSVDIRPELAILLWYKTGIMGFAENCGCDEAIAGIRRFRVFPGWFRNNSEVDQVQEETNQLLQRVNVRP